MTSKRRWKRGRSGPSFVQIPHYVLESPQWGNLPAFAVKLLMELARQYKGNNNGDLSATLSMLKERGWKSEATLWKHLGTLEQGGWIVKTRQGGRHIGCNLYAITWWPIDEGHGKHQHPAEHKPSHLWKNAIGTSKNGVRRLQKMECESVKLQNVEREPVRMRPAA